MTEEQIINLFSQAADDHPAVRWFDFGYIEEVGDLDQWTGNVDTPAVLLSSTGITSADLRFQYGYNLYVMVIPDNERQVDHQAFEWSSADVVSRDSALQIVKDIIGEVKGNNRQAFTVNIEEIVQDANRVSSAVGFRARFTISMDAPLNEII